MMEDHQKTQQNKQVNNTEMNDENNIDEESYHYRMKNLDTGELDDLRRYEPLPVVHTHPTTATQPTPNTNHNDPAPLSRTESLRRSLSSFGWRVFQTVETIGESVVSFLGLDDSYFQEVLDNMTEEEKQQAMRVHKQREEEYRRFFEKNPDHPKHPAKMAAVLAEEEEQEQATAFAALSAITGGAITIEGGGSAHNTNVYEAVQQTRITDEEDIELQMVDEPKEPVIQTQPSAYNTTEHSITSNSMAFSTHEVEKV